MIDVDGVVPALDAAGDGNAQKNLASPGEGKEQGT
jgi:hypothetical protein